MTETPPRRANALPHTPAPLSEAAGPSTPFLTPNPSARLGGSGTRRAGQPDLWTDILRSADRSNTVSGKNVVLLSERHRGRSHLLDRIVGRQTPADTEKQETLAIGYDLLQTDDRDEDSAPPVSVLYPPSSHPSLLRLVDVSLPPHPLPNTAVVIVLDWSKPSTMVRELQAWLSWVDSWAERAAAADPSPEIDEMHERLQSHLQHYTEPSPSTANNLAAYSGAVLPLGQGCLTRNPAGVPIVVVCTRADLMDSVGDEMGMKGGGWEERTDWIQQVLRTVCLAYGAALFYTAPTQPQTYSLLREYLFHRLYTVPPLLSAPEGSTTGGRQRFPFPHRANVLDRDAVMVPAGWDSWGKITILREPFDPARVARAWDVSASAARGARGEDDDGESIEDLWTTMIPDMDRPAALNPAAVVVTTEPEQAFLQHQLDGLVKSDAKGVFRRAADQVDSERSYHAGVVGPMGTGGLSLPGVEKAMAEMEGGAADDMGVRFSHARKDPKTNPTSPTVGNEALHNFFQGLLAKKQGTASASNTPTKPAPPKTAK